MPLDSLEYVVRPYVAPNAQGNVIIPSTPSGSRERATITWGKPTTLPAVSSGVNFSVACCKDTLDEQQRTTETVRINITKTDVDAGYAEFERPTTVNLNKKEQNSCGDNWDDISGVAQAVDADLADWTTLMSQVTSSGTNCGETWKFKNQSS